MSEHERTAAVSRETAETTIDLALTIDGDGDSEVDTGIGGQTADVVGAKIQAAADSHQVLCITHLASIASRSDHHYLVEKDLVEGRTQSTIRPLEEDERVEEIACMLGGARVTTKTREAAKDLLGLSTA